MEDILARVAALEKKIATDQFKKVIEVSCNVALHRLEVYETDSRFRMDRTIDIAARRCNDTIQRNGYASRVQRDEVKALCSNLERRLDTQSKGMANMEAGLKQLQQLESGLIKLIRKDQEDTSARLEELEKSSKILVTVAGDVEACLEAKASKILAKATADMAAGLEAKTCMILAKVTADMAAGLRAKSRDMSGKEQKGNNAKPAPVRGLPLLDLLSSPPCYIGAFSSSVTEPSVGAAFAEVEERTGLVQAQDGTTARGMNVGPCPKASGRRGGRNGQGQAGGVRGQDISRLTSAGRASSVDPPLSQVDSLLLCFSGPSGPTNAEHGAPVTAQGDAFSCSLGGWLQAEATRDINHAQQMAFGRDILRRSRDEHRGRASSVHEMIRAAQGEAYTRSVSAGRSASQQPGGCYRSR